MKKTLNIVLIIIFLQTLSFAEGVNIKCGQLFYQEIDDSANSEEVEMDAGTNVDLSIDFKSSGNFDFGIGYEILSDELVIYEEDTGLEMHPFYGQLKYNFKREEIINPYLLCKLGVNFITESEESPNITERIPGVYFGLGGGVEMGNFLIQLLADVGTASYTEITTYDIDTNTDQEFATFRLNLALGFNFGRKYNWTRAE